MPRVCPLRIWLHRYDAPPGYDLWNATSYRMRLYDVGQSSSIAAEAEALARIADLLNRSADAAMLRGRHQAMASLISKHMWDDELGVFSNLLANGTKYPRISPTSFYPMLAGIASDEQATKMVTRWLTNRTRFCVPASPSVWPFAKAHPGCYWGVPSIAADDPMFLVPGGTSGIYWRGETWSPQVYLVFLGLQRYDHLPVVRAARQGLCLQQQDLLVSVWNTSHHVCENYPSVIPNGSTISSGNNCTGNHFYMWGGLSGFIGLVEAGFYE